MSKYIIEGMTPLQGEINIQGSKNSVLPILAGSILTEGENVLYNCPQLSDVDATIKILRYLGVYVKREGNTLIVKSDSLQKSDIPDELMRELRSSIVFLGPLIARTGKAKLSLPGGCEIGARPIDLHIKALRQMGVEIKECRGILDCRAPNGLVGTKIALSFPSVGATENIIMAAVLAKGTTLITNVANEPEIVDLCDYLNSCGAKIYASGDGTIEIDGVESLCAGVHSIIPDRIAAVTYLTAAAATRGNIIIKNIIPSHLSSMIPILEESGCIVNVNKNSIALKSPEKLHTLNVIRTMPYPGFPTDAQAEFMAMSCLSRGTSVFVENIFENRYKHIPQLTRMGANITVEGKVAIVQGVDRLYGANVEATDLRGAAGLVVAGLAAEGKTIINNIKYLERGYENMETVISSLNGKIVKI